MMLLFHVWAGDPARGAWQAFVWGPPLVALAFVLTIVVLIGMMGRESTDGVREWWSRLGAWLGIYATAWMVMAVSRGLRTAVVVDWRSPTIRGQSLTAGGGWIGTVVAGLFAGKSESTGGANAEEHGHEGEGNGWRRWRRSSSSPGCSSASSYVAARGHPCSTADVTGLVDAGDASATIRRLWRRSGVSVGALVACFAGAAADGGARRHQRVQPQRLLSQSAGALLPGRDARSSPGERNPQNFTGFDDDDDLPLAELAGTATDQRPAAHRELRAQSRRLERSGAAHPPQRRLHADAARLRQRV